MKDLLAQGSPFGSIEPPGDVARYGLLSEGAIGNFLNVIVKVLVAVAGIYALINFILAGYAFLSAGDDPKKIEAAWGKIWQTVIGLMVVAASFVLAAIFGWLIFGNVDAILYPVIPTL
jgi:hypothetical protein